MTDPIVTVRDLEVRVGNRIYVNKVSFDLCPGHRIAILGGPGDGKSLIASALIGMVRSPGVVSGSISFQGRELVGQSENKWCKLRGRDIALVTQDARYSFRPDATVGEQLAEPLARGFFSTSRRLVPRVLEMLEKVGLPDPQRIAAAQIHQLSGGQRQRVGLARALITEPKVLIADGPTTALDVVARAAMIDLINEYAQEHALLFCTAEAGLVPYICDEVIALERGEIVESALMI